jgi:hypothetical protein
VQNSTISGNVADLFAGVKNLGSMMLENSTVSGNIANRDIGGIYNSFSGTLTLRNSTIAANRADFAGGGFGIGAGLHNNNFFGVVMHNTIIVDNVRGSGSGSVVVDNFSGDAANPVSSHNLIGPADSSGLANGGPQGNVVGVANAMLGPLAGNGGPMQTHALLADSPAINAGNNAEVPAELTTDQRGSGFARIANLIVDIGAFEVQSVGPALPGDYNLDGRVNAADYVVWRNTEGDSVTPFSGADGDGNGVVDQADYNVWRTHFGQTMGAGSGSAAVRSSAPVEPVAHSSEPITVTAETQRINGPIAVADSSHGAGKRSAAGRSRDTRPTPAASHHDDALLAWLASRPKATPMVTDYDRESATDAWKDESAGTADDWHVGALDDALASLAEVVR